MEHLPRDSWSKVIVAFRSRLEGEEHIKGHRELKLVPPTWAPSIQWSRVLFGSNLCCWREILATVWILGCLQVLTWEIRRWCDHNQNRIVVTPCTWLVSRSPLSLLYRALGQSPNMYPPNLHCGNESKTGSGFESWIAATHLPRNNWKHLKTTLQVWGLCFMVCKHLC